MRCVQSAVAWRIAIAFVVLTTLGMLPPGSDTARAQQSLPSAPVVLVEPTILARQSLLEAPSDRRWVLRRGHPLNQNAHAHAGGFIYAALGPTYLVVEDSQGFQMQEGQGAWAPEGIGHLHTTAFRASNGAQAADEDGKEVWTILLERANEARQPGALAMSPPLIGLLPGPYEARLSLYTFQPGGDTGSRRRTGPELVYPLDDRWQVDYAGVSFTLNAGDAYLADPGVPHRLRYAGTTRGRLLAAQLVPDGQPAEEPAP